ncbi:MAG: hypothetical protein JWP74_3408 [Marmoricola sp.]|nr:hypothetical protein [Marmoricola sp.]
MLAAGSDPGQVRDLLSSVRDQPSPAIELVVVAIGDDAALVNARLGAGDDTRARFLRAATLVDGRLSGVRRARGRFVLVASPGDRYPPGALADLVPALVPGETLLLSTGVDDAEPADLAVRPEAARFPVLGRLVLPRERALVVLEGRAPEPEDPEGMLPALSALGAGFTPTPYAAWQNLRDAEPAPFSTRRDPLPGLAAHVAVDRATLGALPAAGRAQRALGAINGLRPFNEAAEVAADADWALLVEHARAVVDLARDRLDEVDVVVRAQALLVVAGRRTDLVALCARHGADADVPTSVVGDTVVADLGIEPGPGPGPDDLVLGEHQTRLRAQARRLLVQGDCVVVEVFVGIEHTNQVRTPQVEARLVAGAESRPVLVETATDPAVTRWMAEAEHDHDAGSLLLRIPLAELSVGSWQIVLDWSDGALRRSGPVTELAAQGSAGRGPLVLPDDRTVRLLARHGHLALVVAEGIPVGAPEPTLSRIETVDGALRVTVPGTVDRVWLEGQGVRVEGRPGTAGFWTVPLSADAWGLGERPLVSGGYRLRLERGGQRVPVVVSDLVTDLLPLLVHTEEHRIQVLAAPEGVVVRLEPLLAEDEIGVRAQRRLRAAYGAIEDRLDDRLVYFQSFTGEWAGDHPRAIHDELVRRLGDRRTDLDLRWLVADAAAPVPPGARPVLFRSREWSDVLARASYLVTNIELERWFRRREGQQILQTFHGYPSKAMGLGLWRPRGLLPSQIESQLEHTSRTWNALLTPDPEMDQYYRRDYAYDGRILPLGYPRNDALVLPVAASTRATVRARLGIAAGQKAVLYAPTWRENLATGFRAAEAVHHLDVEAATAALGDDYVLLLRGHRFHAPTGSKGSRVIDVTAYPDINDLILAADVAVLDYSSLRFDFALTGRPMVFLVPDLETYGSSTRGFLWDYRETAPGPLVATTAEVVAALADLDGLGTRWAPDLAAFNERYNRLNDGHASERVVTDFFGPLLG